MKTQPNSWSCLPTAFEIALTELLGLEPKVIEMVGHDGSTIINPNLPDPFGRKSFHIQEMIDVCYRLGFAVTPIHSMPTFYNPEGPEQLCEFNHCVERMCKYLAYNKGVLIGPNKKGHRHAVAWVNGMVIDPNGTTYKIENFTVEEFWMINRMGID